jgi:hypothetical protein
MITQLAPIMSGYMTIEEFVPYVNLNNLQFQKQESLV